MRVLLIGEYSGFFTNLKKGLEAIGVECILASNSDSWKQIRGSNIRLFDDSKTSGIKRIKNMVFDPYKRRSELYGFDVVQFVNPIVYSQIVNTIMFKTIKKHNKKVFVSIAGDGFSVFKAYLDGAFRYYIYDDNPMLCKKYKGFRGLVNKINERYVLNHSNGIIPIMYEYAVGVRNRNNTLPTIPIPFDCSEIEYKPNRVIDGKIVIFHGIIREITKGSGYIIEALRIIEERYHDEVTVIIDGKKPLTEYLKSLYNINILVDQCKENCYGMNAIYAMADGRIVLGGASSESLREIGVSESPIIHIEPNVDQIVSQIESIIKKKNLLEELGLKSRKYVEEVHNHKIIAKKYIDAWNI